jgi:hypothetical protein
MSLLKSCWSLAVGYWFEAVIVAGSISALASAVLGMRLWGKRMAEEAARCRGSSDGTHWWLHTAGRTFRQCPTCGREQVLKAGRWVEAEDGDFAWAIEKEWSNAGVAMKSIVMPGQGIVVVPDVPGRTATAHDMFHGVYVTVETLKKAEERLFPLLKLDPACILSREEMELKVSSQERKKWK